MRSYFPTLSTNKTFYYVSCLFIIILLIEIVISLALNSGLLVYTTDDAYIHLALAENILKGHYGINLHEYSSPSSSILWPLILAPFSAFSFGYLLPVIVNTFSFIGTLYILFLILKQIFISSTTNNSKFKKIVFLFFILLILATNLVGSIFTGMEHSLQIFLTVLIIRGLILQVEGKPVLHWLIAAIIIAPLIRYENLALSFASLFFLYHIGYKRTALFSFISMVMLVSGFSIFLLSLGLEILPFSVFQKSSVVSTGGNIYSVLENFKNNLLSPRCFLLFVGLLFLFRTVFTQKSEKEKLLAGSIAFAILMHLLFGKDGRYVVYIWTASVLTFLFLYKEWLVKFLIKNSFFKTLAFAIIVASFSYNYIYAIITIPIASNNIYEQQFQMHRFAVDYYRKPVAVNDLGYVAYRNNNYVLDLVGLASLEVQNHRKNSDSQEWMNYVAVLHNVKFAMIYDKWFYKLPDNWIKVAELYLGKTKLAPAENVVSFYLLDIRMKNKIISLLNKFKETLPGGVKLVVKN